MEFGSSQLLPSITQAGSLRGRTVPTRRTSKGSFRILVVVSHPLDGDNSLPLNLQAWPMFMIVNIEKL
jgi:hypothetical protein